MGTVFIVRCNERIWEPEERIIFMKRYIYRAQIKDGCLTEAIMKLRADLRPSELIREGCFMTVAVFCWELQLFLYCECKGAEIGPESIVSGVHEYLKEWPGEKEARRWVPMIEVFHFNEPGSEEHWRRKAPVESRKGRVAHLKPEMMSSYIYYHYQLQEERAFHGPKYEIIAMHENLLFGYQEFPVVVEEPVTEGKLNTQGTPKDWNDSRMDMHFQPWEDGHLYFKHIEQIFAYYEEEV